MREEIAEKFSQALSQIDRPGSFCVSGDVPSLLPGLEAKGLGPIGLPLTVHQAEDLKKHCDQAPHGKGNKTVVDTSVRRVWRMGPDRFSLINPDWYEFIGETVVKVQEGLGLEEQELESHLYDLLLYEPGSFFLPHRDGEKHDRMVATLVVVLPSSYEGGEIVIRHDGQEQTVDFSADPNGMFRIHFAAFYADCEHEVRPLKKGYRLCLVYNLTLAESENSISAPRASQHVETIASLLREKEGAGLKTQCVALAVAILAKWPTVLFVGEGPKEPKTGELLESLALLDDPSLMRDFLGVVMVKDVSVDPGPALVPLLQSQGWATFQRELLTLMEGTNLETMERNVRLIEAICLAKPGKKKEGWDALCKILAQALVLAVSEIDRKPSSTDWRKRTVEPANVLAGLARALIATEQFELLSRFLDHALVLTKKYPLKLAHMPALVSLEPWLKKNLKKSCAPLTRWLASCREQLEALTAKAPEEPTDFHRAAPITCKCADCAELIGFLRDPKEPMHRFTMKKERRDHLEREIRGHKCDLDLRLDQRGSPQTLVATKNKASYQEKLKTYHQDQEYLVTVRSIEADLPAK